MSGRVGDLSVKQAEALAQVNYFPFFYQEYLGDLFVEGSCWCRGETFSWAERERPHIADENTFVLNAEWIDFCKSTKCLSCFSFPSLAELCKWRDYASLHCCQCQHVRRCSFPAMCNFILLTVHNCSSVLPSFEKRFRIFCHSVHPRLTNFCSDGWEVSYCNCHIRDAKLK